MKRTERGEISLTSCCSVAGWARGWVVDYYLREPIVYNDPGGGRAVYSSRASSCSYRTCR